MSGEGTNNLRQYLLPVKEIYMKRIAILNIFVLALLCIIGCSDSNDGHSSIPEKIVCDKFNLKATIDGQLLKVSIDTDLPDDTELMVGVYRIFNIIYNQEEYVLDYFSEQSTVCQWRGEKTVVLDDYKWSLKLVELKTMWLNIEMANQEFKSDYRNRRIPPEWEEELNKTYEVDKISDTIEVRMVVPINQSNPRFGYRNKNLVGKAVSTKDLRVVIDEVQIHYPLEYPLKKSPTGRSSPDKKTELKEEALPSELMDKLKDKPIAGNYRIIERNAYKTHWLVYDTKEYKENKDGYTLYPPTYCYGYTPNLSKKWDYEVFNKPEETIYVKELIVVILKKDGKEVRKLTPKAITFAEAVQHIERVSSIAKTKHLDDETALILGHRVATVLGETVTFKPLWYYKRGSLYCINGAAKESTADIPFTYEVDAMTAFKLLDD